MERARSIGLPSHSIDKVVIALSRFSLLMVLLPKNWPPSSLNKPMLGKPWHRLLTRASMVGSAMISLGGTGSDSSPSSASVGFFEVLGLVIRLVATQLALSFSAYMVRCCR